MELVRKTALPDSEAVYQQEFAVRYDFPVYFTEHLFARDNPVFRQVLQRREPEWLVLVPVSGQYSLLNLALRGEAIGITQLALSYVVPLILVVVALTAVSRLIARESLLAGK